MKDRIVQLVTGLPLSAFAYVHGGRLSNEKLYEEWKILMGPYRSLIKHISPNKFCEHYRGDLKPDGALEGEPKGKY